MPTLNQLVDIIATEARMDPAPLYGTSTLTHLGVTSFAMMRLLMRIEDEFEFEFAPEDLALVMDLPASGIYQLVERTLRSNS
jgi:acyl carrier protein